MANRVIVTYNSKTLHTEDKDGNFSIIYGSDTLAELEAGQFKTLNCAGKLMRDNLIIGSRTLNCNKYMMADNVVISAITLHPSVPILYELIGTYNSTQTFTVPEDGYYQIELYGASGNGGEGWGSYTIDPFNVGTIWAYSGGGGGGGAYTCSRVNMLKGETIVIGGNLAVGGTAQVTINSSLDTYSTMKTVGGGNGGNASGGTGSGTKGTAGKASGGNYSNVNGGTGGTEQKFADIENGISNSITATGVGGSTGYTGGNVGGNGEKVTTTYDGSSTPTVSYPTAAGTGKTAFVKIYKGIPTFPATPSAYSIIGTYPSSFTWTAPEDGWYKIELQGASGDGGKGSYLLFGGGSGGGGGGGGCAISCIEMNKGDTVTFTSAAVGSTTSVVINSSRTSYSTMQVTSGGTGSNYKTADSAHAAGGAGGVATGGQENYNGGAGESGDNSTSSNNITGGAGGVAGYGSGNVGGAGGNIVDGNAEDAGTGKPSFVKIYRGNTNIVDTTFPETPTSYYEYGTYTTSQTWVAPATGWYKIEVQGCSGKGAGTGYHYVTDGGITVDGEPLNYTYYNCGGAGGGGGCAISKVKLQAGDTVQITIGVVSTSNYGEIGGTTTAIIASSMGDSGTLTVTGAKNGSQNNNSRGGGAGGAGGVATGGQENYNGGAGESGTYTSVDDGDDVGAMSPASGGSAGYTGGNKGGNGSGFDSNGNEIEPTAGADGFVIIYSGNTN